MDVHATLDGLLLLFAPDLERAGIAVRRDYSTDLPRILADSDRIILVFESLVVNAIEACQGRGGTLTVTTRRQGDRVSVAFTDTGVGMDEAEQAQIFQPFFTTKPSVKGTGLGLPVSHGIVRSHGGEIQVQSRLGQGATFTVLLPVRGPAAEEQTGE
jgi:signal transduction histidine kinase